MKVLAYYLLLFFKGSRPKTWLISLTPFFMATALAFKQTQIFDLGLFILTGLSIVLIQMTVNFFNDLLDGKEGLDEMKTRLGQVDSLSSKQLSATEINFLAFLSGFLAILVALPLIEKGGFLIALAGVLSLLAAYFYTGSSYSLLKLGLSEVSVVLFFGFFIIFGTYYLQTLSFSEELIYLSLQCGFWSLFILLINHIRDQKEDIKRGRKTLAILYGRENSLLFLVLLQAVTYLLCFYWINLFPLAGVFSLFVCSVSCFLLYQLCNQALEKYTSLLALSCLSYSLFGGVWILGLFY